MIYLKKGDIIATVGFENDGGKVFALPTTLELGQAVIVKQGRKKQRWLLTAQKRRLDTDGLWRPLEQAPPQSMEPTH